MEETGNNEQKVFLLPGTGQETDKVCITRKMAEMSHLMKDMLAEDDDDVAEIPIMDVDSTLLLKIVDFMREHVDNPMRQIPKPLPHSDLKQIVGDWDAKFIDVDQDTHFKIILAANYLDMPDLLDLGIAKLAGMIKGKEPDEVKKLFDIEMDMTPEEEKQVRDENPWIFEIPAPVPSAATAGTQGNQANDDDDSDDDE